MAQKKGGLKPKKPDKSGDAAKKTTAVNPVVASASDLRVPVTSLWPGILKVNDAPSGEVYTFENAGKVVQVLVEDIPHLRDKNGREHECCGGPPGVRNYFQIPE